MVTVCINENGNYKFKTPESYWRGKSRARFSIPLIPNKAYEVVDIKFFVSSRSNFLNYRPMSVAKFLKERFNLPYLKAESYYVIVKEMK